MNTQSTNKTWIWVGGVLAVILVGYFLLSRNDAPNTSSLESSPQLDSSAAGAQVLGLLNQLKQIQIYSELFLDPGFISLQDYSVVIPPVNIGRPNPFAPIPGLTAAAATH